MAGDAGHTPSATNAATKVWRNGAHGHGTRALPEEVPVALSYNGSTHAVMMATPADLEDFALGFSLSEDIIDSADSVETLDIVAVDGGLDAQIWLKPEAALRHARKRRAIIGPTGCGLCGVDSIKAALKPAAVVASTLSLLADDVATAMRDLQGLQPLNRETRAVHAAALWRRGKPLLVREDVGRHNALDKVIGAAGKEKIDASNCQILLTSRVSVELVQKTARFGAPVIAAISVPTALALRTADEAGITIAAIVRDDGFEVFTHAQRIVERHSHAA
jgi:FdhD protein